MKPRFVYPVGRDEDSARFGPVGHLHLLQLLDDLAGVRLGQVRVEDVVLLLLGPRERKYYQGDGCDDHGDAGRLLANGPRLHGFDHAG